MMPRGRNDEGLSYPGVRILTPPSTPGPVVPTDPKAPLGDETSLRVGEVSVSSDDKYCFEVKGSVRTIITFCFTNLRYAMRAASQMRKLLPEIVRFIRQRS